VEFCTIMPYPAAAIANEFIKLARESHRPLSPMKLQKLVYFAHGWYLAFTGEPLINEPVEAWQFGPVIPSLYHTLKNYGSKEIADPLTDDVFHLFADDEVHEYSIDDGYNPEENALAKEIIKRIWEVYGGLSAVQLSNLTHDQDAPWAVTPGKDKKHTIIEQETIKNYFLRMLQRNRERQQAVPQNAK
jgi:uncharacterized phage-associated protein